jgi:zinc protease
MMKRTFLTMFAAFLIISTAALSDLRSFNPIEYELDTLDNGLKVIYCVDKSAPVVATYLRYSVGSRYEDTTQTGYAHFFEHLMFEATEDIPRATIDKYVQEAGGTLNANTSFDRTVYFFKVPSNQIKLALWMESQRMRKLLVDTIGVETQRGVVLEELKQTKTNQPYGSMLDKVCSTLFPNTSYAWSVIGYEHTIEKATIDNFRDFYNSFYQPNNATLVIVGDIDVEQTKKFVDDYFGIYPKVNVAEPPPFNLEPMKGEIREQIVDDKAQLPAVFVAYRGPKIAEKDYYPMQMLANVLASGESSRLYQRLVDKDELAVQTSIFPLNLEKSGIILLYGIPNIGVNPKKVEEVMFDEINKIIKKGISDEELQKVKNQREAEFVSDKKDVMGKARSLADYNDLHGDPGMINKELEIYMNVTKEDILRVAKKYLDTKNRVILTYIPEGMQESLR